MSIVRVGSTAKYSANWSSAFGGKSNGRTGTSSAAATAVNKSKKSIKPAKAVAAKRSGKTVGKKK